MPLKKTNESPFEGIKLGIEQLYKNGNFNSKSKIDFYINYRNLSRINDEYQITNGNPDCNTLYLNKCNKLKLTPSTSGLFRKDENLDKLTGIIGSKRLSSLIEPYKIMKDMEYPTQIDLSNNNLKYPDLINFITTLRTKTQSLNLKANSLSYIGAK